MTSASAEAADDVTGVWTIAGQPSAKLLVERQGDQLRIAVTAANEVGLRYAWYVGEGRAVDGGTQAVTLQALSDVSGLRVRSNPRVIGAVNVDLALIDPFRGTLSIGGRSFDVERKELVADGLIAALDGDAPETGWYAPATGGEIDFFESQGATAFVVRLQFSGGQPSVAVVEALKSDALKWTGRSGAVTARKGAGAVVAFRVTSPGGAPVDAVRAEFARRSGPFVEDFGATLEGVDADGNGVRDDIDVAIFDGAFPSSRLREGLAEIARAYRAYLAAPRQETALGALERVDRAVACIAALAPGAGDDPASLVQSLTFNTLARVQAELDITRQAGARSISPSTVSLRNPNDCATFMQGVTRRYDTLGGVRDIARMRASSSAAAADERAMSRERSAAAWRPDAAAAPSTSASCARTKILLVTGVLADDGDAAESSAALQRLIESTSIESSDFVYDSFADEKPDVRDILQYLVGQGLTPRQVGDLVREGFRKIRNGRLFISLTRTRAGLVAAGIVIVAEAALPKLIEFLAKKAIVENFKDETKLAGKFAADIADGLRVIAVSHSRGNLRSNSAWRMSTADVRASVRIASVANAASNVADGGTGATRSDDIIIREAQKFGASKVTFGGAGAPNPDDFTRHFLQNSYLNASKARSEVLNRLQLAVKRARLPVQVGERILAQSSGGFTGTVGQRDDYSLGRNGVTFRLKYEAFSIPDQFDVIYRGRRVASTGGVVSGSGVLNVRLPADPADPTDGDVIVVVYGPDPGTAWNYEIVCPAGSPPALSAGR